VDQYIKRQHELRAQAWEQAKAMLDNAAAEGRDLDASEQEQYDKINAELDKRTAVMEQLAKDAAREEHASEMRVGTKVERRDPTTDAEVIRSLSTGQSHVFEQRAAMSTSSDAGTVPESFYAQLQEILRYTGPAFDPGLYTILTTAGGDEIKVPTQTGFSASTATAEGAEYGESNPTTSSFKLGAFKYGHLVKISRELLTDSGIDIVRFIADQSANAIGARVNSELAVGTGTVQPFGIFNRASEGKVGGTGVGGAFTADDLIDLAHSVDSAYASRPSVGFMMSRASLGVARKLKDSAGQYIYDPTSGADARILGYRVVENPYAPAVGTANVNAWDRKSVLFGDFSSYHVRRVGGVEVARSDDAFFAEDIVAFRVSVRLDANIGQTGAVKFFRGATS
jgi:HK97 family phage major capsid protein